MNENFFDWGSFQTVAGATIIVVVISNTLRAVTRIGTPIIPFVVSLIVSFTGAYLIGRLSTLPEGMLAFFNACLLFCTATGAQETVVHGAKGKPLAGTQNQGLVCPKLGWLSSWIKD